MKRIFRQARSVMPKWASLAVAALMIWALVGAGYGGSGALAAAGEKQDSPAATCPGGICFTDVDASNTFFVFVNALYQDNIISGYACGGAGEPCDALNRPYYRPNNSVTRGQMSKFVDNGRKNISNAIGLSLHMTNTAAISLVISSTTTDSIDASNASGAEAIQAICTRANTNCYAFYGFAQTGDRAAVLAGGRGVSVSSSDSSYAGLTASASGATAYGAYITASGYRGAYIKSNNNSYYSLYVDAPAVGNFAGFNTSVNITGNLNVSGSKGGYVVDAMQNVDSESLEVGDVVVIAGNSPPILGQIPVVTIKKANEAYSTAVVGVVDQVLYVPDAATKATYDREQDAQRQAMAARDQADRDANANGTKPDYSNIAMPVSTITDEQGNVHAVDGTTVASGSYANVVTLGSYKGVKVDASFGAIHAGDLLVSSPNPGYAMKATDRAQANGSVIGKALGNLDSGTGLMPVMVTLK